MLKFCTRFALIALSVLAVGVIAVSDASAQKKISYEQAWANCRAEVARNIPGNEATTSSARQTVAAGCMKKHGYRLKKSSKL